METVITKRCWLKAQLPCYRFKVEESEKSDCIHTLILFKENVQLEQCQCHFEIANLARDAFFALSTPLNTNDPQTKKENIKLR